MRMAKYVMGNHMVALPMLAPIAPATISAFMFMGPGGVEFNGLLRWTMRQNSRPVCVNTGAYGYTMP